MCARWCRSTPRPSSARSAETHRLFTVEENPRLCGWGAEIVSIVADEAFYDLDGPPVRITTPHIPLPAADILEDIVLPTVDRIVDRCGGDGIDGWNYEATTASDTLKLGPIGDDVIFENDRVRTLRKVGPARARAGHASTAHASSR